MNGFDYMRLRDDRAYRNELIDWLPEDDKLREIARLTAKTNLLALCYTLGYTKIDPEIHREALEYFIPRDITKGPDQQGHGYKLRGTLLYPRATFKTTIDEADCVQELICWPEICQLFIMCANQEFAAALVDTVAAHFVKDPAARPTLFHAMFPELLLTPQQRAKQSVRTFDTALRQTSPPIKENALMGFSVAQGASGWHCTRLKTDDMANNRNQDGEAAQEKVLKNYRLNRKMLMPGCIEDKLGTRYGPNDPYGQELKNARPGSYRYVVKPALRLKSGERLDANGFPAPEDVELLFEKIGLTYEILRDEYEQDFDTFMTQYMNDDYGSNEVIFSREDLHGCLLDEEQMPLDGRMFIHWRLPDTELGARAAAGVIGVMENRRMYVLDIMHGVFKPSVLARNIVEFARRHHVHMVTIEADEAGMGLTDSTLRNYALQAGFHLELNWINAADVRERDQRIRNLEPLFIGKRLLLSSAIHASKKMWEQFTNYGMMSDHSIPDVVSRLASNLPASIARSEQEIVADDDFRAALERDRYNVIYSAPAYAAEEHAPEEDAEPMYDQSPANPWGLDDIMPGLTG